MSRQINVNKYTDWKVLLDHKFPGHSISFVSDVNTAKVDKRIVGTFNETTKEGVIYE